jgi:hypothetical protein
MTQSNPQKQYDTGAVRSGDCEDTRYDLISPIGLAALARTYAEGAAKFGAFNWENGMPATDLLNHAIAHIYKFLGGDRSEDHIGHATWNLIGVSHSLEMWPELNNGYLRGPGCTCPPIADESLPAKMAAEGLEQVGPGIYATATYGVAGTAPAASTAASIAASLETLRKAVLAADTEKNTPKKAE